MLSKYIQYFLDENNLEIGEEFMLTKNVRKIKNGYEQNL